MNNLVTFYTRFKNYKYLEYIILALILILGLLVRFYKINNPIADWHSWRQADTASVSKTFFDQGIDLLYPRYHDISTIQTGIFNPNGYRFVEFPIYNVLHATIAKFITSISFEVWGRLLSIFSAVISSLLIYLIGKRFISKWGGILASLFYVLIPFNIYFTRVILPEPMATFFALASLWIFTLFIDKGKLWILYLSGLFFALAMLIKPFVFFYALPMVYLTFKKYGFRKIVKTSYLFTHFLAFTAIVSVPLLVWRFWINQYPEGIPYIKWMFNGDGIRFKPSFWRWIFGERYGRLILGSWGLIPFSLGLLSKVKSYFVHIFIVGVYLYVTIFATVNVRHDYYQTVTIPAVALVLAQGSIFLWQNKLFNKLVSRGFLVFSIGIMFMTGFVEIKEFYKINHPEIIIAGRVVKKLTPKDSLVIAPYNGDTAFLYQTGRWGWPYVDRPINELIDSGADIYVSVNFDSQTKEFMQKFKILEQNDQYVILDLHISDVTI